MPDSVLIPAIFRHVPATSRQHLPTSWDHAQQKSRAHFAETLTRQADGTTEAAALSLVYSLHPLSLHAIWQDIQTRLLLPENRLYHGVKIFFSSKNTKLRFLYNTLASLFNTF